MTGHRRVADQVTTPMNLITIFILIYSRVWLRTMSIESAEVLVPCLDFPSALNYFTTRLKFKVKLITPADNPAVAVVQGYGLTLRLDAHATGPSPVLRFTKRVADEDISAPPEGIQVEWPNKTDELVVPDIVPSLVVSCKEEGSTSCWVEGRAGMQYRDLVPDRQGGRFICSHIRIPDGGEVPDYVHHHHVRFQMIFCHKGWADLVYEDQGPPFRMNAGDCVLQPPHIRHRVLSCSPGLEVIEISCPAQHDTLGDPDLSLPNTTVRKDRIFSGQQFARYQADQAEWHAMKQTQGWKVSDTGLGAATRMLAGARVLRLVNLKDKEVKLQSAPEFVFRFVLQGSIELTISEKDEIVLQKKLHEGDAFVVPDKMTTRLTSSQVDTQLLEVSLPAME